MVYQFMSAPFDGQVSRRNSTAGQLVECLRQLPNAPRVLDAVAQICAAYEESQEPWVIGYSGGKDSTALVKLLFQSLLRCRSHNQPVFVVYCDTGVEIPLAASLARSALDDLDVEARQRGLPLRTQVLFPRLQDRFFVKILGRGYPPPTDKFRWCTDRLRIDPVAAFLRSEDFAKATVVLGVRESESNTRGQTLAENRTDRRHWRRQKGSSSKRLYLPLLDFTVLDVWHTNLLIKEPTALRAREVAELYASASGECPAVREVKGAPCGKARFGCWTCTVAKNGTTLRNLIASGHSELQALLDYRLWLEQERSNSANRWPRRRNGAQGAGPMTLEWRKTALERLHAAERLSGLTLVSQEEIAAIHRLWEAE